MGIDLRSIIATAIATYGLRETARRLGIGETSALRIGNGLIVRRCTERVARTNLGQLSDAEARTG